jgi:hypothetical protein
MLCNFENDDFLRRLNKKRLTQTTACSHPITEQSKQFVKNCCWITKVSLLLVGECIFYFIHLLTSLQLSSAKTFLKRGIRQRFKLVYQFPRNLIYKWQTNISFNEIRMEFLPYLPSKRLLAKSFFSINNHLRYQKWFMLYEIWAN